MPECEECDNEASCDDCDRCDECCDCGDLWGGEYSDYIGNRRMRRSPAG